MDIKQEDLIKFWTWCFGKDGIEVHNTTMSNTLYIYRRTSWNKEDNEWNIVPIISTIDLTTLYEYAIHKLQDKGYSVVLTAYECKGFEAMISDIIHDEIIVAREESDNPTEALYKAIMAVIDKEMK